MRLLPAVMATALVVLLAGPLADPASANSFRITCLSSHVSNDDPIVFPGKPGAAHRHEFFGARTTDAHSTTRSLQRAGTTCLHRKDTAAYWAPTLEVNGRRARGTMRVYYQRAGKRRAAAPPPGLRIVAGSAMAKRPQSRRVMSWQCIGPRARPAGTRLPSCTSGQRLGAWIKFPDCWDGARLDSPDHASHLAYARRARCPRSHPVELMRVKVLLTWNVRPSRRDTVTLGGGMMGSSSMHADFWNSWHQPTLRQLRWDCIELSRGCGELRRSHSVTG